MLKAQMAWIRNVYEKWPDIDRQPGYRDRRYFPDLIDERFWSLVEKYKPYSLIGVARMWNIYESVQYIKAANIPGDLIECGVFLGGSLALAIDTAAIAGLTGRTFWASDTFEGFVTGGQSEDYTGNVVNFKRHPNFRDTTEEIIGMANAGGNKIEFLTGPVESTLPSWPVEKIAYARLDTDDYASTRLELEQLFPRLSDRGVLIVDDYGHFKECRRATDEYFSQASHLCAWSRIDYSCRSGIKMAMA
jgi:hypothetical protein